MASTEALYSERSALVRIDPVGPLIRPPPPPHELPSFITPDSSLFQTIHMGAAVVENSRWRLVVTGLVAQPFSLSLPELQSLESTTVTSFHECYGPPTAPPVKALWRIGNVTWTGVPLVKLLEKAKPLPNARFVWSEGLDEGSFAGRDADRYQKDLPLEKAWNDEVLIAWEMNGLPLSKERGGPVRLVVPGWFGTNSTKWLCRLDVRAERAPGLFTTVWYNELDPIKADGSKRPVWMVEPNSMIVSPCPGEKVGGQVLVQGWAWSGKGIDTVEVCCDEDKISVKADLEDRIDFSWQRFETTMNLGIGTRCITARATCNSGVRQPLVGRRNHVHRVKIEVVQY